MTIQEAIKHAEEVAKSNNCTECAIQHIQLAEWLKEYKQLSDKLDNGYQLCKVDDENVDCVDALFASFEYNRTKAAMKSLCEEVIARLKGKNVEWSDDGNIIYGTIVCLFGDYVTSPRGGWIEDESTKEAIIDLVGNILNDLNMWEDSDE